MFFFEKKEPKNFWTLAYGTRRPYTPMDKSLLLLFFRKEDLPYPADISPDREPPAGCGRLTPARQAGTAMKIIGLEEHFVTAEVLAAWRALDPHWQDVAFAHSDGGEIGARLLDLADARIAAMDETGLDVQVLSLTAPGVQSLAPDQAVALQTASNDLLAETVRARPDRFQGFATLATPDPAAAARELDRAVTRLGLNGAMLFGRTRDRNLDHRDNWPIFEAASALRAPLYIHPQSPVPAVRDAIYGGISEAIDPALATFGLGWHYETGVQILRMVLAGVFDRFPGLQLITGHWGEVVLFYLDRIDHLAGVAKLARPVSAYFREHVSVTPSGLWSERYFRWVLEVLGPERMMFSTDYPYRFTPQGGARRFLLDAALNETDRSAIACGNWERLVAGIGK
jgi:predicted TIM-barrel fold metal-dependent hydrolase